MDILKEISEDRLVIMVTHNADLAERYSTRIIHMLDGTVLRDSAPSLPAEDRPEAGRKREAGSRQRQAVSPEDEGHQEFCAELLAR